MKLLAGLVVIAGCCAQAPDMVLKTATAEFRLSSSGALTGTLLADGKRLTLDSQDRVPGDLLWIDGGLAPAASYRVDGLEARARLSLGPGSSLEKIITVETLPNRPDIVVASLRVKNTGRRALRLDRIEYGRHRFDATAVEPSAQPWDVWSFHGASLKWGQEEITHLSAGFERRNPMGLPSPSGEGGGIPVVALWTRRMGVVTGHIEPKACVISLPVRVAADGRIEAAAVIEPATTLQPGEDYQTPRIFFAVYRGDYYEALSLYAQAVPIRQPDPGPEAYKVAWCAWGYGFRITPDLMRGAIPKLHELHLDWATLDDGWFQTYGDWNPQPGTFPAGAIQELVADLHRQGIRVQLWWYPLAVEDGVGRYVSHEYRLSQVAAQHPEWLILDKDGKHARFSRDLAVLCPAVPQVQQFHRQLTERFLRDWGFDGSKLDVVYSVPLCYNPKHGHRRPEESIEAIGDVYRVIYETSLAIKPDSVTQICPCGTTPNIGWLPFQNQAVAADPHGSLQVRERIKMYKALLGPRAAVTGDHVEYTGDRFVGTDFASTVGLGGIPSTRFTWPGFGPNKTLFLDDVKDRLYRGWIELYQSKLLSTGLFRNLYVHGFDTPEGYAVLKDGRTYYAFFAPGVEKWQTTGRWHGEIELRGLGPGRYRVLDWERGVNMGTFLGPSPRLAVDFNEHLLLEAESAER